ncbi:Synaptonemal complex protein 1 [Turnera subulata]|uniref:Synaptonemal complex protein 1 n=1 Tax=Turnera subulata TaxID=218843 RepID=A0A9Q0JEN2_9ROSI|nr:Synaptonemal complex protein 1 [Turnera subulata]
MQKLGIPSMKTLDQLKSLSGSLSGSTKNYSFPSRQSSESLSSGSFANLKLTAEKLVKEQASVKTDLEMANTKLKKSMEYIRVLEEKLQNAFNENAKLQVKQKEDEKLWKGLDSKFSSTKTLCDQLTETLQYLAGQVQDAEKDKEFFDGKLSASSKAIDSLNQQLGGLSLKLGSAEETIKTREKELEELKTDKNERNKIYLEEQCRTAKLIDEKDAMLKEFQATAAANRLAIESLNSKVEGVQCELRVKEDETKRLMTSLENLEKQKSDFQLSSKIFAEKLARSQEEVKNFEGLVHVLAAQLVELDKQNANFTNKFDELNSSYGKYFKIVQQERALAVGHVRKQYDQLHDKFLCITSDKKALELVNEELSDRSMELQKAKESVMAQLSEERLSASEKIQSLESEVETLMSKKNETEMLVSKLEETIDILSEKSRSSESQMKEFLQKISLLEIENKDMAEKLQAEIQEKAEEADALRNENEKYGQNVDSLQKQIGQLQSVLEEKEQLLVQYKEREKKLEDRITENQASLIMLGKKLAEAEKQHDVMLESKQLELSRHLKEISQRNDQAINEIRNRYDVEKLEIVNKEKEKSDKAILEMERKCEQKLSECKEEARLQVVRTQEEHANLVLRIQQEHDRKEMSLKAIHSDELKRVQLLSENELRERTTQLRNEHDAQMKALRCEHEDECRKLEDELDLQKSKEERQRALLQLQWKVMSDKPNDDQEVNSKRVYSISSSKSKDPGGGKRSRISLGRPENEGQDSPYLKEAQTPVTKILKKVENANTGTVMNIPKHHKKVTHHEYEVEMNNGRTVTKRRKSRSTVMFEDPKKNKRMNTPRSRTPKTVVKRVRGGSNIGDLFSEGSLNPYADDPYAFD